MVVRFPEHLDQLSSGSSRRCLGNSRVLVVQEELRFVSEVDDPGDGWG